VPGAGHAALSNAFPWSPDECAAPADFCTAKVNSQGCTPRMGFVGSPSATDSTPFLVTADQVLNNKTGFLIYGFTPAATPFQGGTLCFSGTLKRTPAQNSGERALEHAWAAAAEDEVPVGAVVVREGRILAEGRNRTRTLDDPTGHAELVAVRRAARRQGQWRLLDATVYVTLEPCAMCAGALVSGRVDRLVYGATDP
jgi:pyrimidine deaminase RibD-like protein